MFLIETDQGRGKCRVRLCFGVSTLDVLPLFHLHLRILVIFLFLQQYHCSICLKSIANQESFVRHMNFLHSEKIVLYLCPICNQGIRWPKNFPSHYEKVHNMSYQDGLAMIKSLKTTTVDNKGKKIPIDHQVGKIVKLSIFLGYYGGPNPMTTSSVDEDDSVIHDTYINDS